MKDSGYGQRLCLKLGGTNERTSGKAELVEVNGPMCVGGVRGCAVRDYGWNRWPGMVMVDAMLEGPGVYGRERPR